jgi:3-methyl-2-oxobutanoate hydroxymethyltransferase
MDEAGVDLLLVGDSLGMVVQGLETTLPVSLDTMVYHTAAVRRGSGARPVVADLPFLTFRDPATAVAAAGRLMQEGGAHGVKLEGGGPVVDTVAELTRQGIPVCAHLGLQPQTVLKLGGYRVQGRDAEAAEALLAEARALEEAGADLLVLEAVPAAVAGAIRRALTIPVIGIGAGGDCDGQILVSYDLLGLTPGEPPTFSRDFLAAAGTIPAALAEYVRAVKAGDFPGPEHTLA